MQTREEAIKDLEAAIEDHAEQARRRRRRGEYYDACLQRDRVIALRRVLRKVRSIEWMI